MIIKFKNSVVLILIAVTVMACTEARLYRDGKDHKGTYPFAKVEALRKYLSEASGQTIKDTIIIKYDFNNETCWNLLDEKSDEYIARITNGTNIMVAMYKNTHPETSVFQFREKGKNLNKLKLRNTEIIIDSGYLLKNIFTTRTTCGTSLKLYPNGNYELIYSDSHFTAIGSPQKQN